MADEQPDPAQAFAALMNDAASAAVPPDGGEPKYGFTTDPETGEQRPKKAAGRPRKSPSIDELKAGKEAEAAGINARAGIPAGDRAPDPKAGGGRRGKAPKEAAPVPQFREGVIAKGVNKLYRRAGKIVKVADEDTGQALIEITRKDDDDDVTVGEAWEEIARTNPRVRKFLLKVIAGGAWGQLVMAHAPVLLAILMKDAVRRHLPLHRLVAAFFSGDEESPGEPPGSPGNGSGPLDIGGLTPDDLQEMAAMADKLMGGVMGGARRAGTPRARASAAPEAGVSPPDG